MLRTTIFALICAFTLSFSSVFSQVTTMNDILSEAAEIVRNSGAPAWELGGPQNEVFFKTGSEYYKLQTYKDSLLFLQKLNEKIGFTYNLKSRQMVTVDYKKSYGNRKMAEYVNLVKDLGASKLDSLAKLQTNHWMQSKAEYDLIISELKQVISICDTLGISNTTVDFARELSKSSFMNVQDDETHLKFIKENLEEIIAEEKKSKK